tara:strand:+ start:1137 stop:2090 length:954 start_codon:yes stop_codon:yes gene_type:complete
MLPLNHPKTTVAGVPLSEIDLGVALTKIIAGVQTPQFLLGVTQTAIGSFLGFLLGVAAFIIQQHRQSSAEKKANRRAALDALNRLTSAACANIVELVNFKEQVIVDFAGEVEKARELTKSLYETPPASRDEAGHRMRSLTSSFKHFYISAPRIPIMEPPGAGEYSLFCNEMPPLSQFAHRAIATMQECNDVIARRNTLIRDQAREDLTGDPLTEESLWYFTKMLADDGDALCSQVDDAMTLWQLVAEQVREYRTHRAKGEPSVNFTIEKSMTKFLPDENSLLSYRKQLVKFDSKPWLHRYFLSLKAKIGRVVPYFSS